MRLPLYDKVICLKNGIKDEQLIDIIKRSKNGYFRVILHKPFKERTTGKKSQNHAINGYCAQIAIETGNDLTEIKQVCKQRLVEKGLYPFNVLKNGVIVPFSESKISIEEAAILIDEIKMLATELDIKLYEWDQ